MGINKKNLLPSPSLVVEDFGTGVFTEQGGTFLKKCPPDVELVFNCGRVGVSG